MTAVIILVILAAGTGWLLWSHLKKVAAEDLERSYMKRTSKRYERFRSNGSRSCFR